MTIGEIIRNNRKLAGITQKQLAEYANVSTKFVVEVENDKKSIELHKLQAVLDVLDLTVDIKPKRQMEVIKQANSEQTTLLSKQDFDSFLENINLMKKIVERVIDQLRINEQHFCMFIEDSNLPREEKEKFVNFLKTQINSFK